MYLESVSTVWLKRSGIFTATVMLGINRNLCYYSIYEVIGCCFPGALIVSVLESKEELKKQHVVTVECRWQ